MEPQEDYSVAYSSIKSEPNEEESLYGSSEPNHFGGGMEGPRDEDPYSSNAMPPSDALNSDNKEEPRDEEEEDDSDEEEGGVQIVLNADAVNSQEPSGVAFPRRAIFSRIQPNQQQRPGQPMLSPAFQRSQQPMIQSPIAAQPPGSKGAFDIDIDGLEEKPWRKPGADITDFFNYGFNEETWKTYCSKQVGLRLEQSMQGKIKVYSSEQPSISDLPPELLAVTGGGDQNGGRGKPKQERPPAAAPRGPPIKSTGPPPSNDWSRPPEHRRRQREQDDSVIQVLASGDDGMDGRNGESPHSREESPRSPRGGPPFGIPPMGRFPPMTGMPRGPPPYERERERDFRREERSFREERPPFPEREFEERREREREAARHREEPRGDPRIDPRERRREERPREERPREERPREERARDEKPREREEKREEKPRERSRESDRPRSRERDDPARKRSIKREEVDDRAKRSRH